jgi:hypothetical protein
MRRVWLIRSGQNAEHIDAMRINRQIAMSFPGIGDVRRWADAPAEQGRPEGAPPGGASSRAVLLQFLNDVHVGDLVVSPNRARHEVWLATVTGDYRFDDEPVIAGHHHARTVEWMGWLDLDAAWLRDQVKSLDRPPMLYELPSREWWWRQVDSRELTMQPRATWSKAAARPSTRAPRSPKPAATPARKPPVALVRCAGSCGYQWAPTSLVDGLCADCRGD